MLVDIVGDHPDMGMAQQHIGDRAQLVLGQGSAGGIVRRIEDQPFGVIGDRCFQILGAQLEAVILGAGHEYRGAAGEQDHVRIGHPIRGGNDDLVAGIEGGHQGVVDHLLAAGTDRDFLSLVVELVLAPELLDDRRLQLGHAVDGRCIWCGRRRSPRWPPA